MDSSDKGKQVDQANVTRKSKQQDVKEYGRNKGKEQGPLMILTSGKVVGNIRAQWKEVRDKCVQDKGNEFVKHEQTGKEIVSVDKSVGQEVQTTNKFVVLEVEDGEINENNQLALVEDNSVQKSPIPKEIGKLNTTVVVFTLSHLGLKFQK